MTTTQIRMLEAVRRGLTTRKAISEETGMQKGFAKVMGAVTKGKCPKGTLVGDGLLKAVKGDDGWEYELTSKGKGLLGKESKADITASMQVREVTRTAKPKAKGKASKAAKGKGKGKASKAAK